MCRAKGARQVFAHTHLWRDSTKLPQHPQLAVGRMRENLARTPERMSSWRFSLIQIRWPALKRRGVSKALSLGAQASLPAWLCA